MYVRLIDGLPHYYTASQLRQDNPQVSFPANPPAELLAEYGVFPLRRTSPPLSPGMDAVRVAPELVDGTWRERWELRAGRIPDRVTMRQARLALLGAGLLQHVEPAIEAIADPVTREAVRITWEYSTEVQRRNPFIATLAAALGMTDADVDNLFRSAALL